MSVLNVLDFAGAVGDIHPLQRTRVSRRSSALQTVTPRTFLPFRIPLALIVTPTPNSGVLLNPENGGCNGSSRNTINTTLEKPSVVSLLDFLPDSLTKNSTPWVLLWLFER